MPNPFSGAAGSTSRSKMRKITGHGGGGHSFDGSSHYKHAGKHGVIKAEHPSRRKAGGHVHGKGAKARLDKFASGGRTKKGDTNVTVVMPHGPGAGAAPPPPPPMPPPAMGGGAPPMGGAPLGGGMPGGGAMPGGTNPMQALGALSGGTGSNPLAGLGRGFKHGGKALRKASHGKEAKVEPLQMDRFAPGSMPTGMAPPQSGAFGSDIIGDKKGGRKHKASGGGIGHKGHLRDIHKRFGRRASNPATNSSSGYSTFAPDEYSKGHGANEEIAERYGRGSSKALERKPDNEEKKGGRAKRAHGGRSESQKKQERSIHKTYGEAAGKLPKGAKWSSTFGNPGDEFYSEYHRDPSGRRFEIAKKGDEWDVGERKKGGHVKRAHGGRSVGEDLSHWKKYAHQAPDRMQAPSPRVRSDRRAKGGRLTAGAESGVGRLEKAEHAKRKH